MATVDVLIAGHVATTTDAGPSLHRMVSPNRDRDRPGVVPLRHGRAFQQRTGSTELRGGSSG
jgi:hypothetical protein